MRAALAVAAALLLAGCTTGNTAGTATGSDTGFVTTPGGTKVFRTGDRPAAPAITGTLLDGSTFRLADERGHVVVLNVWGSWCAPCRAEAADLQSVYVAAQPAGVVFVGINLRDDHDAATAYLSAHGITYPSLFDPAGRVTVAFRDVPPTAIPSTLVIDANGRIAAVHLDIVTRAELTSMIAAASS
jgi:peroxiredoxin